MAGTTMRSLACMTHIHPGPSDSPAPHANKLLTLPNTTAQPLQPGSPIGAPYAGFMPPSSLTVSSPFHGETNHNFPPSAGSLDPSFQRQMQSSSTSFMPPDTTSSRPHANYAPPLWAYNFQAPSPSYEAYINGPNHQPPSNPPATSSWNNFSMLTQQLYPGTFLQSNLPNLVQLRTAEINMLSKYNQHTVTPIEQHLERTSPQLINLLAGTATRPLPKTGSPPQPEEHLSHNSTKSNSDLVISTSNYMKKEDIQDDKSFLVKSVPAAYTSPPLAAEIMNSIPELAAKKFKPSITGGKAPKKPPTKSPNTKTRCTCQMCGPTTELFELRHLTAEEADNELKLVVKHICPEPGCKKEFPISSHFKAHYRWHVKKTPVGGHYKNQYLKQAATELVLSIDEPRSIYKSGNPPASETHSHPGPSDSPAPHANQLLTLPNTTAQPLQPGSPIGAPYAGFMPPSNLSVSSPFHGETNHNFPPSAGSLDPSFQRQMQSSSTSFMPPDTTSSRPHANYAPPLWAYNFQAPSPSYEAYINGPNHQPPSNSPATTSWNNFSMLTQQFYPGTFLQSNLPNLVQLRTAEINMLSKYNQHTVTPIEQHLERTSPQLINLLAGTATRPLPKTGSPPQPEEHLSHNSNSDLVISTSNYMKKEDIQDDKSFLVKSVPAAYTSPPLAAEIMNSIPELAAEKFKPSKTGGKAPKKSSTKYPNTPARCTCQKCGPITKLFELKHLTAEEADRELKLFGIHICPEPGCGKEYRKSSHFKAHYRWHEKLTPVGGHYKNQYLNQAPTELGRSIDEPRSIYISGNPPALKDKILGAVHTP